MTGSWLNLLELLHTTILCQLHFENFVPTLEKRIRPNFGKSTFGFRTRAETVPTSCRGVGFIYWGYIVQQFCASFVLEILSWLLKNELGPTLEKRPSSFELEPNRCHRRNAELVLPTGLLCSSNFCQLCFPTCPKNELGPTSGNALQSWHDFPTLGRHWANSDTKLPATREAKIYLKLRNMTN